MKKYSRKILLVKKFGQDSRFLCCVSGGQDSLLSFFLLFHLLKSSKKGYKLDVIYCQHFWQPKNFVCTEFNFHLNFFMQVPWALILPQKKLLSENKSREWRKRQSSRFRSFQKLSGTVIGHTRSDIFETKVNTVIRGTSPKSFFSDSLFILKNTNGLFFSIFEFKPNPYNSLLPKKFKKDPISPTFQNKTHRFPFLSSKLCFEDMLFLRKKATGAYAFFLTKKSNQSLSRFSKRRQPYWSRFSKPERQHPFFVNKKGIKTNRIFGSSAFLFFLVKKGPQSWSQKQKLSRFSKPRKGKERKRQGKRIYNEIGLVLCSKNEINFLKQKGCNCSRKRHCFAKKFVSKNKNLNKTERNFLLFFSRSNNTIFFKNSNNKIKFIFFQNSGVSFFSSGQNKIKFGSVPFSLVDFLLSKKTNETLTQNINRISVLGFQKCERKSVSVFGFCKLPLSQSFCLSTQTLNNFKKSLKPLENLSRYSVLKLVTNYHLPVTTDKTNFCTNFSRNKIRHQIFPFLKFTFNKKVEYLFMQFLSLVNDDFIQVQNQLAEFLSIFQNLRLKNSYKKFKTTFYYPILTKLKEDQKKLFIKKTFFSYREIEISFRQISDLNT